MRFREGIARRGWVFHYTAGFALLALAAWAIFAIEGKSFVWMSDGYLQSYPALEYIGNFWRSPGAPAIDFSLGQGLDALTTLSYYGIADPINILTALVPAGGVEIAYAFAIAARVYLSGLFFGLFCRETGATKSMAIGALLYAFSGFMLYAAVRHPLFINGPMYLPLMLLGAEWTLKNRRTYPFVIFTCLMLITNFYFAYMNTLFTVIYATFRLIFITRAKGVKPGARAGFRLLFAYALGMGLAAVVFLPTAYAYIGNARFNSGIENTDSLLWYEFIYYGGLLLYSALPRATAGHWAFLNFAPPAFLPAIALLCARKPTGAAKWARRALVIMLVCLCVPLAGKIFNGFGYVTNRWSYALAFPVSYIAVIAPNIGERAKRVRVIVGASVVAGACCAIYTADWFLLVICALIAVYAAFFMTKPRFIAALGCLLAFLVYTYAPFGADYVSEFADKGVRALIMAERAGAAAYIDDSGFYRVAQRQSEDAHASIVGYNGVGYYWSIVPSSQLTHFNELELSQLAFAAQMRGYGDRAELYALAAVKYYIADAGASAPPGYELLKSAGDFDIYQNKYALPLGYVFDEYIARADYAELSAFDKLAALTRAAIIDFEVDGMARHEFVGSAYELDYDISDARDIEISGSSMRVSDGARLEIEFSAPENCRIYFSIEDMKISPESKSGWVNCVAESGDYRIEFYCMSKYCMFGYDQTGASAHIGDGATGKLAITFSAREGSAIVDYSAIKLYAAPVDDYIKRVDMLRAGGMYDIIIGKNSIAGRVSADKTSALQIAIPYSEGWTAFIDGAAAELFLSGGMYTGLMLDAGEHEIELKYETPLFSAGAWVSLTSLALGLVIMIIGFIRRRRCAKDD